MFYGIHKSRKNLLRNPKLDEKSQNTLRSNHASNEQKDKRPALSLWTRCGSLSHLSFALRNTAMFKSKTNATIDSPLCSRYIKHGMKASNNRCRHKEESRLRLNVDTNPTVQTAFDFRGFKMCI